MDYYHGYKRRPNDFCCWQGQVGSNNIASTCRFVSGSSCPRYHQNPSLPLSWTDRAIRLDNPVHWRRRRRHLRVCGWGCYDGALLLVIGADTATTTTKGGLGGVVSSLIGKATSHSDANSVRPVVVERAMAEAGVAVRAGTRVCRALAVRSGGRG